MYSLIKRIPRREIVLEHLPTAGGSLLVAELFYKFGSFSLEALAFLGTWFLADLLYRATQRTLATETKPIR